MKKWLLLLTVLYCLSLCGCQGQYNVTIEKVPDTTGDSLSTDTTETTFFFDEDPTKEMMDDPENVPTKETEGKQEEST